MSLSKKSQRLSAFAFFIGGTFFGVALAIPTSLAFAGSVDKTYEKLRIFSQVLSYVQANYVDHITETELIYDSVNGMLQDLDPHSTFMRPSEYNKLKEDTSGEFGGLGITISEHEKGIIIDDVNADGPAERAGLRSDDLILAIGNTKLGTLPFSDGVQLLRGLAGTKVVLRIRRKGWKKNKDVPLIRRNVRVVSVEGEMLTDDIGYVTIHSFQERTDHDLALMLTQLKSEAKGGKGLRGLVLDLRDNPGGLLDEGVKVADRFLQKGDIVRTEGRNPRHQEREVAHIRSTEPKYPMAVLINGGSASASEIVAGALQDQQRAVLVGQQSYGKGSVQVLFGLDDGSGLKLTVARYYTPSGRSIDKTGIAPDKFVRENDPTPKAQPGTSPRAQVDLEIRHALQSIAQYPKDLGAAAKRKKSAEQKAKSAKTAAKAGVKR
ncbi:MAG: S41 family peptidase [Deltaproteobacteria bacterium]|nr:S41 family peptidase [Deltaproteobacteria bacterium]